MWRLALFALLMCSCAADQTPRVIDVSNAGALDEANLDDDQVADVVVIVTLDGVRWQEIFEGVDRRRALRSGMPEEDIVSAQELLPNLYALLDTRGASVGAPSRGEFSATGTSNVSLPAYFELFTGLRKSGCDSNDCPAVTVSTLADEFASLTPLRTDVAVYSSWSGISRAFASHKSGLLFSCGRSDTNRREVLRGDPDGDALFELGAAASPDPGWGDYRPDRVTGLLALHHWREHHPRFLFVGLGDSDEHGHHGDYAGYLGALRHADVLIGELTRELPARALLIVTSDHGRNHYFSEHGRQWPESRRSWLVAAGHRIDARGHVESPRPRTLADVSATVRMIAGFSPLPGGDGGRVLWELLGP